MKAHNEKLQTFREELKRCEHLGAITNKTVWQYFGGVIAKVDLGEVFVLPAESIELFSRLKVTSIAIRLEKASEEECKLPPTSDFLVSESFSLSKSAALLNDWISAQEPSDLYHFSALTSLRQELDSFCHQ